MSHGDLLELAREVGPTWLVVPDVVDDFHQTQALERDFRAACAKAKWPLERLMMPVQAQGPGEATSAVSLRAYETAKRYRGVALPRALKHRRVVVADHLRQCGVLSDKAWHYVHALGWIESLGEMSELAKLGVRSLDSGSPVWRGLLGHSVDRLPLVRGLQPADVRMVGGYVGVAEANVRKVDAACRK